MLDRWHRRRGGCAARLQQQPDGHWVFELEADATIPAEYVLLRALSRRARRHASSKRKIAVYLRRIQGEHGGWPLFHDGAFDMSASVKAYFALKMIGDDLDAPHMARAREAIRSRGGAARANVFTRLLLALFGVIRGARAGDAGRDHAAAEVVSLPPRQDLVLGRTVIVPLLVLQALKPRARNPTSASPSTNCFSNRRRRSAAAPKAPQQKATWFWFFRGVDIVLRMASRFLPRAARKRAIDGRWPG